MKRFFSSKFSFKVVVYVKACLLFLCLFCGISNKSVFAQPANDNFAKAEEIKISDNGYGKGTFSSSKSNLTKATKEAGESFHLLQYFAGTDKKSVWFYFETQLHRSVTIELKQQDSLIAQDAVGFTIYKTNNISQPPNLGDVDETLTPVSKFGSTTNTCFASGKYYIQVSARQNANADIWINLKINDANPAPYDLSKFAYNFGTASGSKSINYDVGCQALDNQQEIHPVLGKDFNKTTWATFSTDNYSDNLSLSFQAENKLSGPDTVIIGYRLYKGDVTKGVSTLLLEDTAIIVKACHPVYNTSCGLIGRRDFQCPLMPNTTYSVQLYFYKDAKFNFTFNLDESGDEISKSANPKTLPAAYKLGVLQDYVKTELTDRFACNSFMKDNLCGKVNVPLVIDSTYIKNDPNRSDTFDLSLWQTFEIKKTGVINLESIIAVCNNSWDNNLYFFRLFNGDVTKNCDLSLFTKRLSNGYGGVFPENLCIGPGVYSLQVLGRSVRNNVQGCSKVDLGKFFRMRLWFEPELQQKPATHYLYNKPEDMGNITSQMASEVKSKEDFFGSPEDSINIKGQKIKGRFIYRQFYIANKSYLTIREYAIYNTLSNKSFYLFAGRVSDGLDSLKRLPDSIYGGNWFSNYYQSQCTPLPAGWYTIISTLDLTCNKSSNIYSNLIYIKSFEICKKKFNRPYKAHIANGGVALDYYNSLNGQGETSRTYTFTEDCFACELDTPVLEHPLLGCKSNLKLEEEDKDSTDMFLPIASNRTSYYVFTLKRESQVSINVGVYSQNNNSTNSISPTQFQLYKGDARKDSLNFTDPKKQLLSCTTYGEFCYLQPGTYTIVALGERNEYLRPVVQVERIGKSAYDFASNAADLGFLANGAPTKYSKDDFIFCTTGAYATDPDSNLNRFTIPGMNSSVPYPMVEDFDNSSYNQRRLTRRNLWYTFNCKGTGKVTVSVVPKYEGPYGRSYNISIYKSDEKGSLSFSQLKAMGKIDSTNQQGLVLVANNWFNNTPVYRNSNTVQFEKQGCDSSRYYVIVDWQLRSNNNNKGMVNILQLNASYREHLIYNEKGDYCSNAEKILMSEPGTSTGTTLINCHTKGEGFGEDGSNMGCLVNDGMKYKTSWFKLIYTGSQRVDLSFSIKTNSSADPSQISYRVLYGNCKAMTPGPCVANAYSSFKLDCMGAGDYYIQVVSPEDATGNITVEANAIPTTYPVCKPADLLKPFANFSYTGGCNNDPVQFLNLSSAGEHISYKWDFGNGSGSTAKDTIIQYSPAKAIDTFWVTLLVINDVVEKYDSLTIPVIVFRDPIIAGVKQKYLTINCLGKIKPEAESNYPFSTFEWLPKEGMSNPYSANPDVIPGKEKYYTVTIRAESCIVQDTVFINISTDKIISGDTVICPAGNAVLRTPPGYHQYLWKQLPSGTLYYGQNLTINKPGKYALQTTTKTGCVALDTAIIIQRKSFKINLGKDTFLCPGQQLQLQADINGKSYLWTTGEKTSSISVNKPGVYWLRMHLNDSLCDAIDTIIIKPGSPTIFSLGKDTVICPGIPITLAPDKSGLNYIWSGGETSGSIIIDKPGKYWLRMQMDNNYCEATDTIVIKEGTGKAFNLGKDTAICPGNPILLQPDITGFNYQWSTGDTTASILINKPGKYWLLMNKGYCERTDTIVVKEQPLPSAEIPAQILLCGNQGVTVSAAHKTGRQYVWSSGATTLSAIFTTAGKHFVTILENGCSHTDTFEIKQINLPVINLGKDTSICGEFNLLLDAGEASKYHWQPGGSAERFLAVNNFGRYIVKVFTEKGCETSDTINIKELCEPVLWVPTAFTPGNPDFLNDLFRAVGQHITYIDFRVYNRWGERIFQTNDMNSGWDGTYRGRDCQMDVYLWTLEYRGKGVTKYLSGTVTLLR